VGTTLSPPEISGAVVVEAAPLVVVRDELTTGVLVAGEDATVPLPGR
jgi:hypothetical protein